MKQAPPTHRLSWRCLLHNIVNIHILVSAVSRDFWAFGTHTPSASNSPETHTDEEEFYQLLNCTDDVNLNRKLDL